jgi:hypothetical protein
VLAHVKETAPKRNVWVMIDVREEAPKADQGIFDLPGVDSIIAFPQEDHGLYLVNRLHCNPHYEVTLRQYKSKINKIVDPRPGLTQSRLSPNPQSGLRTH